MNDPTVIQHWEKLQKRTDALIARVEALSDDLRRFSPDKKTFNALEMLEHLVMVEQFYIPNIKQLHVEVEVPPPAKPNFLYRFVVNKMRTGKPMATAAFLTPKSTPNFEVVLKNWKDVRAEVAPLILSVAPNVTFVKHPFFGRLGPLDYIELTDAHLEYHEKRFPVKHR